MIIPLFSHSPKMYRTLQQGFKCMGSNIIFTAFPFLRRCLYRQYQCHNNNACQQNTHDEVNAAVVQISVCAS